MVPIINKRNGEVVGGVGCLCVIDMIQPTVENTLKTREEVAAISIYSSNGFVIASYVPDRVGKMLKDVDTIYGSNIDAAFSAVQKGEEFECSSYAPTLKTNVEITMQPFPLGNSGATWSIMIASARSYILKEVNYMTRFTIIIAVIAIIIAAVIVYFVLQSTTKPIVKVSETLKDISEGEGDLTHVITVSSKDEVAALPCTSIKHLKKSKTWCS